MKKIILTGLAAFFFFGCEPVPPPYEKIDWDFDGRTDATLIWGKENHLDSMVIKEPPVTVRYQCIEKTLSHGKKVLKHVQLDDKLGQTTYLYTQKPLVLFSETIVKGQGTSWGFYDYNVLARTEYDRNQDGRADYIIYFKKLRRDRIIVDDDYNGDFEKELVRGVDF